MAKDTDTQLYWKHLKYHLKNVWGGEWEELCSISWSGKLHTFFYIQGKMALLL